MALAVGKAACFARVAALGSTISLTRIYRGHYAEARKKYRPTCEYVAFFPVGLTASRASTTIGHSAISHGTDGASF
jgi:hypothetical protein